jgi:glyceraldehyde-3-phosphate dehydrogenase/erythrose-4-phosphate dehydrogenase
LGPVKSRDLPDKAEDDELVVNGQKMFVVSAKDPAGLPWKQLGVDVVSRMRQDCFTEVTTRRRDI